MAENVSIFIKAFDKTRGVFRGIRRASANMTKGIRGDFSRIGGVLGALGIAVGGAALIKGLIGANVEFQNLKVRLETFTGSAENAAAVFQQLADFAAATPFELQDSVNAFIDLRAVGIEPTVESLTKMADVSAAFGTSIVDLSGAIRSAVKGELEPIGKFGAVFRTDGEKIRATFQGVTTVIDRTAEGIAQYIEKIGESEGVSGSAQRQMDTLGGAISNMKDNFFQLATTIGEGGISDMLFDWFQKINAFIETVRTNGPAVTFWVKLLLLSFKALGLVFIKLGFMAFDIGQGIVQVFLTIAGGIKLAFFKVLDTVVGVTNKARAIFSKITGIELEPFEDFNQEVVDAASALEFLGETADETAARVAQHAKDMLGPFKEISELTAGGLPEFKKSTGKGLKLEGTAESSFKIPVDQVKEVEQAAILVKSALKGIAIGGDEAAIATGILANQIETLNTAINSGQLGFEDRTKAIGILQAAELALDSVTQRHIKTLEAEAAALLAGITLGGATAAESAKKLALVMDKLAAIVADGTKKTLDRAAAQALLNTLMDEAGQSSVIEKLGEQSRSLLAGIALGGDIATQSGAKLAGVMARLNVLLAGGTLELTEQIEARALLNELEKASVEGAEAMLLVQEAVTLQRAIESGNDEGGAALVRLLEIRQLLLDLSLLQNISDETRLGIKQRIAEIDETTDASGGIDAIFDAIRGGTEGANFEIETLADGLDFITGTALANFGAAWGEAFGAAGEGAKGLGKAVLKGSLQGIAGAAKAESAKTAIDAAAALAKGLTNPVELAKAAKLFAVSAAYGALASKLGGGGGGGGATGGGAGGFGGGLASTTEDAAGDRQVSTITIEGGLINMDDPRQAQAFEDAVNRLAGAGRIEIVGA